MSCRVPSTESSPDGRNAPFAGAEPNPVARAPFRSHLPAISIDPPLARLTLQIRGNHDTLACGELLVSPRRGLENPNILEA